MEQEVKKKRGIAQPATTISTSDFHSECAKKTPQLVVASCNASGLLAHFCLATSICRLLTFNPCHDNDDNDDD